ncbi:MAG: EamA family transporter [Thermoplasmatales archaeon]|nr:EamA family transporter [Thermoplasmatales archaeon]MCW6170459.1 EamA family transporter [Thermoplasmatales archaeon]
MKTYAYALLAFIGASMWGLSATIAQYLFSVYNFPAFLLLFLRLFVSTLILLPFVKLNYKAIFSWEIVLFAIFGVLLSQLTYLLTIEYANASIATVLQYLFLPLVALFEMIRFKIKNTLLIFAVILAFAGTFIIATDLQLKIVIPIIAVVTGLLSAFAAAYYTLASRGLLSKFNSWSMMLSGFIIGSIVSFPFSFIGDTNYFVGRSLDFILTVLGLAMLVVVLGTVIGYGFYLKSLERISGSEAAIFATMEPLTAMISSLILLGTRLHVFQYLGAGLILFAILIISMNNLFLKKKPKIKAQSRG